MLCYPERLTLQLSVTPTEIQISANSSTVTYMASDALQVALERLNTSMQKPISTYIGGIPGSSEQQVQVNFEQNIHISCMVTINSAMWPTCGICLRDEEYRFKKQKYCTVKKWKAADATKLKWKNTNICTNVYINQFNSCWYSSVWTKVMKPKLCPKLICPPLNNQPSWMCCWMDE